MRGALNIWEKVVRQRAEGRGPGVAQDASYTKHTHGRGGCAPPSTSHPMASKDSDELLGPCRRHTMPSNMLSSAFAKALSEQGPATERSCSLASVAGPHLRGQGSAPLPQLAAAPFKALLNIGALST